MSVFFLQLKQDLNVLETISSVNN
uniref:Uncharacterized protein n=1 Tax=Anguilla anguilla TaxID=7936 RepID=A0A0E9SM50_ANGAN